MKVLVTGGTGFLGSHVVERLLADGHSVRALVRPTSDTRHLRALSVERVVGAVDEPASLPPALRGVDAVIHCAGLVKAFDESGFDRVNALGVQHMVAAVRESAPGLRRLVLVSSIAAGGPGGPEREPGPVSAYGRSKRRGEQAALAAADVLPVTVVRPPAIYGPRDREVYPMFRAASHGVLPILGDRDARFSMIYVEDCAAALAQVVREEHPSGAIYPVDDGADHTWAALSDKLAAALGVRRVRSVQLPRTITRWAGRIGGATSRILRRPIIFTEDKVAELSQPDWRCGHTAITRDIGWQPAVPIEEGLARTAAWYREQGWLR